MSVELQKVAAEAVALGSGVVGDGPESTAIDAQVAGDAIPFDYADALREQMSIENDPIVGDDDDEHRNQDLSQATDDDVRRAASIDPRVERAVTLTEATRRLPLAPGAPHLVIQLQFHAFLNICHKFF